MDGLTKPEPPLSRACCVSPDLYRPIGKFQVVGRIWKPEFNVPIIAGHGPSHPLTSTDQGCCHQPQAIPVRGLVSSAEATRTRALTTGAAPTYVPGVRRSTNWATGRTKYWFACWRQKQNNVKIILKRRYDFLGNYFVFFKLHLNKNGNLIVS